MPRHKTYLTLLLLITFVIYLPGANGPYLVDDSPNLLSNETLLMDDFDFESLARAATSSPSSFLGRPIAMVSFALNYTIAGNKNVLSIKLTNIILHLLTGLLVFILIKMLMQERGQITRTTPVYVALLTATLWILHPLHVSTVLYSIQRMTMLASMFSMLGMIFYIYSRRLTITHNRYYFVLFTSLGLFTLLGLLSKENGALLPVYVLLTEWFLFKFDYHPKTPACLKIILPAILIIPTILIISYLLFSYINLMGQIIPPHYYTIGQRLLTESRALVHYLGWIMLINPFPMSLFHEDFILSSNLFEPFSTFLSVTALLVLFIFSGWSLITRNYIFIGFGIMWFLIGHLLESTSIPLALVYEHRNYLPSVGILFSLSYLLVIALLQYSHKFFIRITPVLCIVGLLIFLLNERVLIWKNHDTLINHMLANQRNNPWVWAEATIYLSRTGRRDDAIAAIQEAQRLEKREPAFVFNEAIIRCNNDPEEAFPERLAGLLTTQFDTELQITPVSIQSFIVMANQCGNSAINQPVLRSTYKSAELSGNSILSGLGKRALSLTANKQSH